MNPFRHVILGLLLVSATVTAGCSGADDATVVGSSTVAADATTTPPSVAAPSTTATTTTAAPPTSAVAPPPTPTAAPPATSTVVDARPAFRSSISPVDPATRARMDGLSMRPGCPVGYDDLRYLRMSFRTFEGATALGEMVVHRDSAEAIVSVFQRLYEMDFPIRRMQLVDDFGAGPTPADGASDFRSIEADNTSAFNCRNTTGATSFSQHSYGRAIDLNPIENPYVTTSGTTSHDASRPFLDRTTPRPGVVLAGSATVEAFASIGWEWGGTWAGIKDYQHFSENGH